MENKDISVDATPQANTDWKKSCSQCLLPSVSLDNNQFYSCTALGA